MIQDVCDRIIRLNTVKTNNVAVSEITIERCMVGPMIASLCTPRSSKEDEAIKGKWVRVARDLNRQSGLWHLVSLGRFSAQRNGVNIISDLVLPTDKAS